MFAVNTYLFSNSFAVWKCRGYLGVTRGRALSPGVSWQEVGWSLSPVSTTPLHCWRGCCFSLQLDHGYFQLLSKADAACAFSPSYEFQPCSASYKELTHNYSCFMSKRQCEFTVARCKLEKTAVALPGT